MLVGVYVWVVGRVATAHGNFAHCNCYTVYINLKILNIEPRVIDG